MNTLNWEKLPTFKANRTLWGQNGAATSSLEQLLGQGKTLQLDMNELEGMFAKPEVKLRTAAMAADDKPKASKVILLDAKRSTSVGIVMKRITDALQGKELRDALMDVDENLLPLEVLQVCVECIVLFHADIACRALACDKMVLDIRPTAEERNLLVSFAGDLSTLDRPEQLLRALALIPRLEGRLRAMMTKCQLEVDMDGLLMQRVDDLRIACKRVRDSTELHALMRIVLEVGNALNAGTSKGNAVGFKLSTLLKLAELKAADKKTTLLHYVVNVVRQNTPTVVQVVELQTIVRNASRVSLDELAGKKGEAELGLKQIDDEITWHDEQRLREGVNASDDDQFPEVFTEFYNWASERMDDFAASLANATSVFRETCEVWGQELWGRACLAAAWTIASPPVAGAPTTSRPCRQLLGESETKEPEDVFDTLEKFLVRFEAASNEVDEAKRVAESQIRSAAKHAPCAQDTHVPHNGTTW
jgi:hypothetical protein